jgi:hypothetical protein
MLSRITLALLLIACAPTALGESKQFGRFEVLYSVVNTTFVEPDTAAAYDLVRARDRAFVNIAVRERLADGGDRAVSAKIEGRSWDFYQNTYLEFREIREGGAIYYIADFEFNDKEVRFFNLRLLPEGASRSQQLKFHQQIYEE